MRQQMMNGHVMAESGKLFSIQHIQHLAAESKLALFHQLADSNRRKQLAAGGDAKACVRMI
ncbi:hypothetical protein D3C73_1533600 [compost metagenome]